MRKAASLSTDLSRSRDDLTQGRWFQRNSDGRRLTEQMVTLLAYFGLASVTWDWKQ